MDYKRDRIKDIINYLESLGIVVNIGKNKARGNKGFFQHKAGTYRIDVSANLNNDKIISVIIHEFAHFIHYKYDKTLTTLEFIFGKNWDTVHEELINITVLTISKEFATSLFNKKSELANEIKTLSNEIKRYYPDFKISKSYKQIEKDIPFRYKFLLKYDRVRIFSKEYSVDMLDKYADLNVILKKYIELKYKNRCINRINSKIRKLNNYYSNTSELFARFAELYFLNKASILEIAPAAIKLMEEAISTNKIEELSMLQSILKSS